VGGPKLWPVTGGGGGWRVPSALAERARQLAAGTLQPVAPRDAATVVLLRDAPAGLEVHLMRRVASMAFAAGMHVFPGGRVDDADAEVPVDLPAGWPGLLGADEALAGAVVVAAVRETFEEAGVLLTDDPLPADLAAARLAPFASLGVRPATRLLAPWARWITPDAEPRRYDTRFFVAALPAGQHAAADDAGGEADRAVWLTPADALARHRDGELDMLPPTAFTLAELTECAGVGDVLAAAVERDCAPVLPRVLLDADGGAFLAHEELR